jgi:type IV secretory pathway ATPase VirB11/archaellum biosynthesis ATPase
MTDKNVDILRRNPIFSAFFKEIQEHILNEKNLIELRVNRPLEIVLEFANGGKKFVEEKKLTQRNLITLAQALAQTRGLVFNERNPIMSTKLPGGHRVQIMGFATVESKFSMSIRIKRYVDYKLADYGITPPIEKEIIKAIKDNKTLIVSGGTGTGKTSLLNVLINYMDKQDRIISIEDVIELNLDNFKDKVQMLYLANGETEMQANADTLLRSALRMNPTKILVGEIHIENAETFCSAINTGHEGSIATIHANSPKGAIASIIMKVIMQGANDSAIKVLQKQLCEDVYAVLQIKKDPDGKRSSTFLKLADFSNDKEIEDLTEKLIKKEKLNKNPKK